MRLAVWLFLPLSLVGAQSANPQQFAKLAAAAEQARTHDQLYEAANLYRRAVELRPGWAEGWWYLGTLLYDQDRFAEAEESFTRFVPLGPKPGPALALLGLCEYETRHLDRALLHLEGWQRAGSPGTSELGSIARFHLALLATHLGQFDRALGLLAVAGGTPFRTEAAGLAALHMKFLPEEYPARDRELVMLAGHAVLAKPPNAARLAELRAKHTGHVDTPERAAPVAAPLPATPRSFDDLARAAEQARTAGGADETITLYRQALRLRPDWPEGQWYLGTLLYEKERFVESRDVLRRFVAADPSAGPGWALVGLSEFKTREYGRALAHLQRGLSIGLADRASILWAARFHAAALLTRLERFDEANTLLLTYGAEDKRSDEVIRVMGLAALQLPLLPGEIPPEREEMVRLAGTGAFEVAARRTPQARQPFQQLAEKFPDDPRAHFVYGAFLLGVEDESGMGELKRVLELDPEFTSARIRLAFEYLQRGEIDPGLPYARAAAAAEPGSFPARLALGRLLLERGEVTAAIRELEAARELSPESAPARWVLASAYARAGREPDAARERAEGERLRKLQKP